MMITSLVSSFCELIMLICLFLILRALYIISLPEKENKLLLFFIAIIMSFLLCHFHLLLIEFNLLYRGNSYLFCRSKEAGSSEENGTGANDLNMNIAGFWVSKYLILCHLHKFGSFLVFLCHLLCSPNKILTYTVKFFFYHFLFY